MNKKFRQRILLSLKDLLGCYGNLPKEIKDLIKFDQIPLDVYERVMGYYYFEKELSNNFYIDCFRQELRFVGKGINDSFLGMFGFIELIGINKFDRYNTIELYNRMLEEIRSLPDINNSNDINRDYKIFREILSRRDSPSKDLGLVLPSRFLDEYKYYNGLVNKY